MKGRLEIRCCVVGLVRFVYVHVSSFVYGNYVTSRVELCGIWAIGEGTVLCCDSSACRGVILRKSMGDTLGSMPDPIASVGSCSISSKEVTYRSFVLSVSLCPSGKYEKEIGSLVLWSLVLCVSIA